MAKYDILAKIIAFGKNYDSRVAVIFTRKSSYCFQRILAKAILSVSVHPSVTRVDQSKRCKLGLPNLHHQLPGRL